MTQCSAKTKDGKSCQNFVKEGQKFCHVHRKQRLLRLASVCVAVLGVVSGIVGILDYLDIKPFTPTSPGKTEVLSTATTAPAYPSNIILIPTDDKNIMVEMEDKVISSGESIPLNTPILVTFTILNNGSSPAEIRTLVIGSRGPGVSCEDKNVDKWSAQDNPFPAVERITIQPGEKFKYQGSRAFYQPGKYFLEPNIQALNGTWGGIQPFSCINIIVESPLQTPTPNPTLTALYSKASTPFAEFTPQFRAVDGVEEVWIPEGSFVAGDISGIGYEDEEPFHIVYTDGFWIDRNLITNSQYASCPKSVCADPSKLDSHKRPNGYYGIPAYNNYPVINVTWQQANDFCNWRGGRLPTEAEFEKAAGWNPNTGATFIYPWGDFSPTDQLANYDGVDRDTTQIGSYPKGMSPTGVYDMAGNVWEWTSDWYTETYYVENQEWNNPTGPAIGVEKVVKGGSWYSSNTLWLRVSNRGKSIPDQVANEFGFRCVFEK